MIDWHSHILPKMDDGSHDVAESIALIQMQASQGIDTVVATPHFYANDGTVQSFLHRRQTSLERLKAELPAGAPEIVLGAEVKYYPGISRLADLKALRIEGSKLLLLEMPMSAWSESTVRELVEMSGDSGIRLVLAHVERYWNLQKPRVWNRIRESGILMQVNAGFFGSFTTKRKAFALLRDGYIQFVGSDCHSVTSRPPRIGKAYESIQKKFGEDYLRQMNEYGYAVLTTI